MNLFINSFKLLDIVSPIIGFEDIGSLLFIILICVVPVILAVKAIIEDNKRRNNKSGGEGQMYMNYQPQELNAQPAMTNADMQSSADAENAQSQNPPKE